MYVIHIVEELRTVIDFLRRLLRSFLGLAGFLLCLLGFLLSLLRLDFLYALTGPLCFLVRVERLLLRLFL